MSALQKASLLALRAAVFASVVCGVLLSSGCSRHEITAPVERKSLAIQVSKDNGVNLSDYSKEVQELGLEIAVARSNGGSAEVLAKYQKMYEENRDAVALWRAAIREAPGYLFADESYVVRELRTKYPSCAALKERFVTSAVVQQFWACTAGR